MHPVPRRHRAARLAKRREDVILGSIRQSRCSAEGDTRMPDDAMPASPVGAPLRRFEDARLVTGAGRFVDDIAPRDALRAVVLRSPHARAAIRGVDARAALSLPGVVAVLTGAELSADGVGGIPWEVRPPGADTAPPEGDPRIAPPQPALAQGKVRYVGEPVALVIGTTLAAAKDGAEAVDVEYDPLPAAASALVALVALEGAAPLHAQFPDNLCHTVAKGDAAAVEAAFAKAAHVVALDLVNQRLVASPIEPRAYVGAWADGRFTLIANAGKPHPIRRTLARFCFGVEESAIRVISPDVGGGFGAKNVLYPEEILVLWAARRLGRPVRWVQERSEVFLSDMQGRGQWQHAELALDDEGRALALRVRATADLGAWLGPRAVIPTISGLKLYCGTYRIPAAAIELRAGFSAQVPTCPYRGAGHPEAINVIERLMDAAARQVGLTPEEIRRRNLVTSWPWRTPLGSTYDSGDYAAAMDRALLLAGADGFAARRAESEARGRLRGLGIANVIECCGSAFEESAWLRADADGGATVLIGTKSSGQSHETAYAQLVAQALGLPPAMIRVVQGDTDAIISGNGTGACRSLTTGGSALLRAGEALVEAGREAAATLLEASVTDVAYAAGRYVIAGTDRGVSLAALAAAAEQEGGTLTGTARFRPEDGTWPAGCHVAEVEVDPETGGVVLLGYAFAHDVGIAVNPMVVLGQLQGGCVQGIGQALMEHAVVDAETAQPLAGSLMDYALPRASDIPSMAGALLCTPTALNPLGAKAVGEAGPTAAPPAVVNAILDALAPIGVRHIDMPATPELVWQAIRDCRRDR
jgi:carbon-monoxide dehydrogenase large subunit